MLQMRIPDESFDGRGKTIDYSQCIPCQFFERDARGKVPNKEQFEKARESMKARFAKEKGRFAEGLTLDLLSTLPMNDRDPIGPERVVGQRADWASIALLGAWDGRILELRQGASSVDQPEALAILDSGSKDDAPEAARENRDQPLEALEADRITPQGSEFDDVQEEAEASQDANDTNELLKLAGGGLADNPTPKRPTADGYRKKFEVAGCRRNLVEIQMYKS